MDDLQKLEDFSNQLNSSLQSEEIVVEKNGVKIVIRGDECIKEVLIGNENHPEVTEALNEALMKTKELAARKMLTIKQ